MLTVSSQAIGRRKPLFADFSVPPPEEVGDGGEVTVRRIIESVVRHEVAAFQKRQHGRQFLRVLSERAMAEGESQGKIEAGGSEVKPQDIDVEEAIAIALDAFEDAIYLVVLDETEIRSLDQAVYLRPDSRLTFIRLSLLAGG